MRLSTVAVNALITAAVVELVAVLCALFSLCIALFGGLTATTVAVCTVIAVATAALVYFAFEEEMIVHVYKLYPYTLQPTSRVKEGLAGAACGLAIAPVPGMLTYVLVALGMSMTVAAPVAFAVSMLMFYMNIGYVTLVTKRLAA